MKKPTKLIAAKRIAATRNAATCKPLAAAPMWLVLAAVALIAILASVLIYALSGGGKRDTFFASPPPAKIVFLYMDGCGWCEKFKPQWSEFAASPALRATGVVAVSYERKDPAASAFGAVEGYPTVLLVAEGKPPVKFQGDRTPEGLFAFLAEHGYSAKGVEGVEGYYEEPQSELGGIHHTVSSTKQAQDEKVRGQQASIQANAGGDLKSTSASTSH